MAITEDDNIMASAIAVGTLTGTSGILGGSIVSVIKGIPRPGIFAVGTGLSCFVLGTMYSAVRQNLVRELLDPRRPANRREKVQVSAMAGGITGGIGGLVLRGHKNILPGAVMFTLFGMTGQMLWNVIDTHHTTTVLKQSIVPDEKEGKGIFDRILRSEKSPIKRLTDEEYKALLRGKILSIEADIAILDEEIATLRKKKNEDNSG